MTTQEAIKDLKNVRNHVRPVHTEAFDMAIRSLEAWDNLAFEMETAINYYDAFPDIWYGISEAYDIIKKYLKEV